MLRETRLRLEVLPEMRKIGWVKRLWPWLHRLPRRWKIRLFPQRCAFCGAAMQVGDFWFRNIRVGVKLRTRSLCRPHAALVQHVLTVEGVHERCSEAQG